jgi:hypothetical protein
MPLWAEILADAFKGICVAIVFGGIGIPIWFAWRERKRGR